MSKIIWIAIGVVIILGLVYLTRITGDIRPAVLPPKTQPSTDINASQANPALNVPSGFTIDLFAENVGAIRDLEFSPGGTLLASVPSDGKVIAFANKDGKTDIKEILTGLDRPHGIAFYQNKLFVAEETRVVRYFWDEEKKETTQDKILFTIPAGGRHFTRSIVFDNEGKLYISLGSTCDVCNENLPFLAAVIVSDSEGNNPRLYSKGLRNSVFITVNPATGELWGTEMGRDFLGDELPPDEVNILKEGKDYGWPNCYGNRVPDRQFNLGADCNNTEPPVYGIAAHSAPLGLVFINSSQFPADWQGDLLVAYHGSWNRSNPIGYKVVRMNVEGNKILGEEDVLTGFLEGSEVIGRPVDLIFDKAGNLYISDDKAGGIYTVSKQ